MSKKKPTNKFKIYKIKEEYIIEGIIDDIKTKLEENEINYDTINKDGYKGIIYSNESDPSWIKCIHELMTESLKKKYQKNNNMSYVLLKESSNKTVYAISGGQGYHHLKGYYEKNYGLNLIPKLINNTDSVVRNIIENRLYDNQIYNHRVNRRATSLNVESDFTNLYKELGLVLDVEILTELGLIDNEHFNDDLEHIRFTNKDFVFVEKSLTFKNLEYVFDWLDSVNENRPNFELNSFIEVSGAENHKPSELLELLISSILDENTNNYDLEIVGEDIVKYLSNDKYSIKCNEIGINIPSDTELTWNKVVEHLKEKSLFNKDSLELTLKQSTLSASKNGIITLNSELIKCLDCKLYDENDNTDYFLLDGKWYYIDDTFEEIITEKFTDIYEESLEFSNELVDKYDSLKDNWTGLDKKNETNYNASFEDDSDITLIHPLRSENIEIADMIIYDKINNKSYFICIKDDFGYPGCRDVYGQIKGSYNYIKNDFSKNNEKINAYYTRIAKKNTKMPLTEDEFKKAMNGEICYIAGFFDNFRENPTLPIKILTNDIYQKLNRLNIEFHIMRFKFD